MFCQFQTCIVFTYSGGMVREMG
ncbi:hypothetical protein PLANTIT3_30048 [Plantibacter sp. T3]|nr:hypothetical protein PLANTIT3_30048 [Plantibacter sp. T3]